MADQETPTPRQCGAETRTCERCGCHQREHEKAGKKQTRRGPCLKCGAARCPGFKGRPHSQTIGLMPNGRCKIHGGKALSGMASPSFKTGNYSKMGGLLPARMLEDYERLLHDDELLSLREEIALQRTYYRDLMKRAEDGALAGPRLVTASRKLLEAWQALANAPRPGKAAALRGVQAAIDELRHARGPASAEVATRKELRETWLVLARLTRDENDRIESLYNMISAERAIALRAAETKIFLEELELHVKSPEERVALRRAIASRFVQLADRGNRAAVVAAGGRAGAVPAAPPAPDE